MASNRPASRRGFTTVLALLFLSLMATLAAAFVKRGSVSVMIGLTALDRDAAAFRPAFEKALRSVRFSTHTPSVSRGEKGTEGLSQAGSPPAPRTVYRDPQNRFHFCYQPDWTLRPFPGGQGVSLRKQHAAITVMGHSPLRG